MMSLRLPAVLLLVAAMALQASAAPEPRPFDLAKTIKGAVNTVKGALSPGLKCLKDAGAGDAALGYLQNCGQTKYFGKTAMASCAATTYAPADVKAMLKSSAACFNMG